MSDQMLGGDPAYLMRVLENSGFQTKSSSEFFSPICSGKSPAGEAGQGIRNRHKRVLFPPRRLHEPYYAYADPERQLSESPT
jgi:hypothetical protein